MTDLQTLAIALLANFRTISFPASEDRCRPYASTAPDWFQTVRERRADRRPVETYRDRLRRKLVEHGYHRFFHYLEADPEGGWRLHFFLADDHALSILTDVSEDQCGPGDPLDFDPEEFIRDRLGRLKGMDPDFK